ncbi:MAG: nucleotidyl transferase AbiEii/AbiGii toxin family protein [Acidithiobacillus sp.]
MGRVMGANAWEALFDKGMVALDSLSPMLPAPNWTMGGGTVLMFRYHHRLSQDVDIFLTDAQYLTALSPRLNDQVEDLTDRYREDSQHVKLIFPEFGEVDFVVAPRLIPHSTELAKIHGRIVALDKPEEIIAKKCFYRADGFTARDVFDMAVFLSKDTKTARQHLPILTARREEIAARLEYYRSHKTGWDQEIGSVHPLPGFDQYRRKALDLVTRFYDGPEKWLNRRTIER